jgi:hypothetical protein
MNADRLHVSSHLLGKAYRLGGRRHIIEPDEDDGTTNWTASFLAIPTRAVLTLSGRH